MTFLGDMDFVEGRSASKTTTLMLRRCLGCVKEDDGKSVGKFLDGLKIKAEAFFRDIDGDWGGRPFIGQHVFKVVQAAGYEGTENDLWATVTGSFAPYPVRKVKVVAPKKAKAQPKALAAAMAGKPEKPARRAVVKTAWAKKAR
jgi:hypothetical protein